MGVVELESCFRQRTHCRKKGPWHLQWMRALLKWPGPSCVVSLDRKIDDFVDHRTRRSPGHLDPHFNLKTVFLTEYHCCSTEGRCDEGGCMVCSCVVSRRCIGHGFCVAQRRCNYFAVWLRVDWEIVADVSASECYAMHWTNICWPLHVLRIVYSICIRPTDIN